MRAKGKDEWRPLAVVWRASLLTAFATLPIFLIGALAPVLRAEHGVEAAQIGLIGAAFFATSALAASIAGSLTERLGTRAVLIFTAATTLVAMGMFAAALPVAWMYLAAIVAGLGQAFAQPGTNTMLAATVPVRRLGVAISAKQAAIPLATLISGALVSLVAAVAPWPWVFIFGVGLALVMVIAASTGPDVRAPRRRLENSSLPRELRVPRALIATGAGAAAAAGTAIVLFLTEALVDKGISVAGAGLLLAVAAVFGAAMRIFLGLRADRRPDRDHFRVIGMLLLAAVPCIVLTAAGHPALAAIGGILAYVFGFSWNGLLMYALVMLSPSTPGRATGLAQIALGAGATVGPLLFGVLRSGDQILAAWGVVCVLLVFAGCCLMLGGRMARRMERP